MERILVVDDDEGMRGGIVAMLKSEGYAIIEADNGMTALDLVAESKPDLIISDIMMANLNGFMFREMLKSNPDTADIPMILMTGYAKDAGAWGADPAIDYLTKPFAFEELLHIVDQKFKKES